MMNAVAAPAPATLMRAKMYELVGKISQTVSIVSLPYLYACCVSEYANLLQIVLYLVRQTNKQADRRPGRQADDGFRVSICDFEI